MDTFVWYSKSSQESGELLAQALGTKLHGTVPPKGFVGMVINFGAAPKPEFRWQDREFHSIYNDIRKGKNLALPRMANLQAAYKKNINTIRFARISEIKDPDYQTLCNLLIAEPDTGFYMTNAKGFQKKLVKNQNEFQDAVGTGLEYATPELFSTNDRKRVYYGVHYNKDGFKTHTALACMTMGKQTPEQVAASVSDDDEVAAAIVELCNRGQLKVADSYTWNTSPQFEAEILDRGRSLLELLGLDFAAIDFDIHGRVINYFTAPSLEVLPEAVRTSLANNIKIWVAYNTRPAKDILKELVETADEEEAEALLSYLREKKNSLTIG